MLPFESVNIVAVLAATVVSMILGMLWYSPKGFGALWMQLTGITMEQAHNTDMKVAMAKGFVNTLIGVYVVALILTLVGPASLVEGMMLGALLMLATAVPMQISGLIWEYRPVQLMYINVGYSLVSTVITITILMNWPAG
jgi:hypothetical protein